MGFKEGHAYEKVCRIDHSVLHAVIYQFAQQQSLPCVRGGGPPKGGSEGLCRKICEFASLLGKFATFYRINLSVMLFA